MTVLAERRGGKNGGAACFVPGGQGSGFGAENGLDGGRRVP